MEKQRVLLKRRMLEGRTDGPAQEEDIWRRNREFCLRGGCLRGETHQNEGPAQEDA